VTTDPLIVELLLREGGDSPLFHWWYGMVVIIRMQMALFVRSVDCRESVTVCWQKGVVGGYNYRRTAEYVLQQTAAMRQRMDAVDRR
jgi:hypothetical protein